VVASPSQTFLLVPASPLTLFHSFKVQLVHSASVISNVTRLHPSFLRPYPLPKVLFTSPPSLAKYTPFLLLSTLSLLVAAPLGSLDIQRGSSVLVFFPLDICISPFWTTRPLSSEPSHETYSLFMYCSLTTDVDGHLDFQPLPDNVLLLL